jgi:hypothetical protein
LEYGNWRPLTDANKQALRESVQAASADPTSSDPTNLLTGVSSHENVYIMPKAWMAMGESSCLHYSLFSVLAQKRKPTSKIGLSPHSLFQKNLTSDFLTGYFGVKSRAKSQVFFSHLFLKFSPSFLMVITESLFSVKNWEWMSCIPNWFPPLMLKASS